MLVRYGGNTDLTVGQIADHLGVRDWSVTRELQLGQKGQPHRLQGAKVVGPQIVGSGGQWRVKRGVYLDWLQIPDEDRGHLGSDGLPELITFEVAAGKLGLAEPALRTLVRQNRWPHIAFGRKRYFTHNQLERARVQLEEDLREATPGGEDLDGSVT